MLAIGIWTVLDKSEFEELLGTDLYVSAAYIFVATGVVVTLISLLGCMGAIKEIRCMLFTVRQMVGVRYRMSGGIWVAGAVWFVYAIRVQRPGSSGL